MYHLLFFFVRYCLLNFAIYTLSRVKIAFLAFLFLYWMIDHYEICKVLKRKSIAIYLSIVIKQRHLRCLVKYGNFRFVKKNRILKSVQKL